MFHLPFGDTSVEASEWIHSSSILTSVRMLKNHTKAREWHMNLDDMALALSLFQDERKDNCIPWASDVE